MKFKSFLKENNESDSNESVNDKINRSMKHEKHANKGKKCKKHKIFNCEVCVNDKWN